MDLLDAYPSLKQNVSLANHRITLIGVSTVVWNAGRAYFEISKPKYWRQDNDGNTLVGIGGIGGSIEAGESVLSCLRREIREELGAQPVLEIPEVTYLIRDWAILDTLNLPPSRKRPTPLMIILMPPQLGGAQAPDHVAIVSFCTRLRSEPAPHDVAGLLRVEGSTVSEFFSQDQWGLEEIENHPGLALQLNSALPSGVRFFPTLTARAFQLLVRAGYQ
ncbi:MAG: NUDIX domain-containing protein [Chloroflexi bacterium]|nr:NUDIX domain-containing protein [Chloroflexota bacterium]